MKSLKSEGREASLRPWLLDRSCPIREGVEMKLLLFLFMVMPLFGEKMEIVAYHVGKGTTAEDLRDQLYWAPSDPFSDEGGENLRGEIKSLAVVPFKSRFLREGDDLVDFSGLFVDSPVSAGGDSLRVVLNKTTGKVVMQGSRRALLRIGDRGLSGLDAPIHVEVKFAIYDVPNRDLEKMRGLEEGLPRSARKIEEALLTVRPGDRGKLQTSGWLLECGPNIDSSVDVVDLRMEVQASFVIEEKKHQFELKTGIYSFDGVPVYLKIGSMGQQSRTAVLAITATGKLIDGTDSREQFLKEGEGKSAVGEVRRRLWDLYEEALPQEDGRVFKRLSVSPSLVNVVRGFTEEELSSDPFSDESTLNSHTKLKSLKNVSPLVQRRVGDELADLRDLMERNGLKIQQDDFVVLNVEDATISALLLPDQLELLELLLRSPVPDIPRHIVSSLTLLESDKLFTIDEIAETRVRRLNRLGLMGLPGDKLIGVLSSEGQSLDVTLEPHIGADASTLDLRLVYRYRIGKEVQLKSDIGLTVDQGKAVLIGQHQHEGKWRALLVEADYIGLDEELGE